MDTQTEIFADLSQPCAEELLLAEMRRALALLDYTRAAWDASPASATLAKNWGCTVLGAQKTFEAGARAFNDRVQVLDEKSKAMNEISNMNSVENSRELLDGIVQLAYRDAKSNEPMKNLWLFKVIFPTGLQLGMAVADIVYRVASAVLKNGHAYHPEINDLNAQVQRDINAGLVSYPTLQPFVAK